MQHLRSTISRPGKRHLAGVGLVCLLVLACDPLGLDSISRTRVQGTPRKVTPTWTVVVP
ncbi:MAG: hypothetical protein H0U02_09470 [Rubrobacter sp.]|nr:hypothetical protein [Rubrobacter sp.]